MNNFKGDIKREYNILNLKIEEIIKYNRYLYEFCFIMTYDDKIDLLKKSKENNRDILDDYSISERELEIYLIYNVLSLELDS